MTPSYRLTDRGLIVGATLSHEEWLEIGTKLAKHLSGIQWAIGDWLLALPRRQTLTETLEYAAEVLPHDVPALRSHAMTARAFVHGDRIINLAWSFYRETMPLQPEQRLPALREAFARQMKYRAFKAWVVTRLDRLPTVEDVAPVDKVANPDRHADHRSRGLVCCPHCDKSFYIKVKHYEDDRTLVSIDRQAIEREERVAHA